MFEILMENVRPSKLKMCKHCLLNCGKKKKKALNKRNTAPFYFHCLDSQHCKVSASFVSPGESETQQLTVFCTDVRV